MKYCGNRSGSVIVISLVVAVIFITLCGSYFGFLAAEASNMAKSFRSNLALHLAESGVEEAIWEFNYKAATYAPDDGWTGTNPKIKTTPFFSSTGENLGSYTVTVTNPGGTSPVIRGTGQALYQTATLAESRAVEVTLETSSSSYFNRGVFGDERIVFDSNACSDSFNSEDGPYDPDSNCNGNGDIGTNSAEDGAIRLDANASVEGDAVVGVDGDPGDVISVANQNVNFVGETEALETPVTMPYIVPPLELTSIIYEDPFVHADNDADYTLTPDQNGTYSDFSFEAEARTLYIQGDVELYITGTFEMSSNTNFEIMPNSSLTLYVDGSINFESNVSDVSSTDPADFTILGTNSMVDSGINDKGEAINPSIVLNSNTDLYATIVAPNATVEFDSNIQLMGAVMADNIEINSNSCVHYDEALGDNDEFETRTGSVAMWQEI